MGRFGDEWCVFFEDGRQSVIVRLYKVLERCGWVFDEFGVADVGDKLGEVDGG